MKIKAYKKFERSYRQLPENIKQKTDKQLSLLTNNFRHSSLHTKKIKGRESIWEVRINYHYRLTFEIIEETIFLRVAGHHDEVLKHP